MPKRRKYILAKIRTDMKRRFREASCLAVNVGVFASGPSALSGIPQNLSSAELLRELRSLGADVLFYGPGAGDFLSRSGLRDIAEKNGHRAAENPDSALEAARTGSCVVLGSDMSDLDIFRFAAFSAVSLSAPLDLRMVSDYVSNFDGEAVFEELGSLIARSKKEEASS